MRTQLSYTSTLLLSTAFAIGCGHSTEAPPSADLAAAPPPKPAVQVVTFDQFLDCKQIKGNVPVGTQSGAADPHFHAQLVADAPPVDFFSNYQSNGQNYDHAYLTYHGTPTGCTIALKDEGHVNGFREQDDGRELFGSRSIKIDLKPIKNAKYKATLTYSYHTEIESTAGVGSSFFDQTFVAQLLQDGQPIGTSVKLIKDGEHQAVFNITGSKAHSLLITVADFKANVQGGYGNWRSFNGEFKGSLSL